MQSNPDAATEIIKKTKKLKDISPPEIETDTNVDMLEEEVGETVKMLKNNKRTLTRLQPNLQAN